MLSTICSLYTYNLKLVYDAFDFILIKVLNGWGVSTRALEGVVHCIAMFLSLVWYVEDKIDLKFQLEVSRVQDTWILKEENKKIRSHYIFAKIQQQTYRGCVKSWLKILTFLIWPCQLDLGRSGCLTRTCFFKWYFPGNWKKEFPTTFLNAMSLGIFLPLFSVKISSVLNIFSLTFFLFISILSFIMKTLCLWGKPLLWYSNQYMKPAIWLSSKSSCLSIFAFMMLLLG